MQVVVENSVVADPQAEFNEDSDGEVTFPSSFVLVEGDADDMPE